MGEALAPERAGRGAKTFAVSHPVQRSRRRLYVKLLLRRARAYELLQQPSAALEDLKAVREPVKRLGGRLEREGEARISALQRPSEARRGLLSRGSFNRMLRWRCCGRLSSATTRRFLGFWTEIRGKYVDFQ